MTSTYTSVAQDMFRERVFSSPRGIVGGASPEGDHAVTWLPWHLQIQEQDAHGAWHQIFCASFPRRSEALAAAERMGVDVDYISHHRDSVESICL